MEKLKISQDFPISRKSEDLLGRTKFAEDLAKAIHGYDLNECLTIGIFGEWGSGKSSLINLIKEELISEKKVEVVKFEPWLISDLESLIPEYLNSLEKTIEKKEGRCSDVRNKISEYKKNFIIKNAKNILSGINISASLFGAGINADLGKILDKFEKSLSEYKQDVVDSLKDYNKKIVVFIDDIDRLDKNEIKTVFKLIKSVADFPNIVYVLAFDRAMVARVLDDVQEGYGDKYMQKIVQVSYTVPEPSNEQISNMLENEINEFVKTMPSEYFDKFYFHRVYRDGLDWYINNIRDVKRILNAFKLKYYAIGEECSITDLLAITILEIFEPEVVKKIWNNRGVIFSTFLQRDESRRESLKKDILSKCVGNRFKLENLLTDILPILNKMTIDFNGAKLRNKQSFSKYFTLSLDEEEISRYETGRILKLETAEEISSELNKLIKSNLIASFFEKAANFVNIIFEKITSEHKTKLLNALSLAKWIEEDVNGFNDNFFFLVNTILKKDLNVDSEFLIEVINDSKNDVHILGRIMYTLNKDVLGDKDVINNEFLKRLQIEIKKEEFLDQIQLWRVMYVWKRIDETSFMKYIKEIKDEKMFYKKAISFIDGLDNANLNFCTAEVKLEQIKNVYGIEKCESYLKNSVVSKYLNSFNEELQYKVIALKIAIEKDINEKIITISGKSIEKEINRIMKKEKKKISIQESISQRDFM